MIFIEIKKIWIFKKSGKNFDHFFEENEKNGFGVKFYFKKILFEI